MAKDEVVLDELRHAVRNLGRAPRFVCACVVTLALALAGTATLVNLLEAFVFRTLAVPAPEQLIGIYPVRTDSSVGFSPATLAALRARQRPVEAVSGNCYEVIGVRPSLGRAHHDG
jgi:hypothetical protein